MSDIRSNEFVSPTLWYLRVQVIEAQDVQPNEKDRCPEVFVKVRVENQQRRTRLCTARSTVNPIWNEELVLVVSEPFEEHLELTVEDRVHPMKEEVLGKAVLPLILFEKRLDDRPVHPEWFNLERFGLGVLEGEMRIHLRVYLDGACHVMEHITQISDTQPAARQLWKQPIGVLEVGILSAQDLLPMKVRDGRGTTDAYCVAKYGQKWVRTRTILNSFRPKWNEQYTWEVYDPCTVITLGVFDNCHLGGGSETPERDSRIGKVRIWLSTLETDRTYTNSYPLVVLEASELVKKMGELQLTVRFTSLSLVNMIQLYGHPLLPKMHYLRPLTLFHRDYLRHQATIILAARLGRAKPPLRREVVAYMLHEGSLMWNMRQSKDNFLRIMLLLSGVMGMCRRLDDVRQWRNPIATMLVHALFLTLVCYTELILPTVFLCMFMIGLSVVIGLDDVLRWSKLITTMLAHALLPTLIVCYPELIPSALFLSMFLIGVWNYRFRPWDPPQMVSTFMFRWWVDTDDLDKDFDPSSMLWDYCMARDGPQSVAGQKYRLRAWPQLDTRLWLPEPINPDDFDEEFDTFPTSRDINLVRLRYERLRSVAGWFTTMAGDVAAQGERLQALPSWKDPRATPLFMVFCLVTAVALYVTPFRVVALVAVLYWMRHPRFRSKLPSIPSNFVKRLPSRLDTML